MRREAAAAVVLIVSLSACCGAHGAADRAERTFLVGDTTFAMDLPKEAEIGALAGSPGVVRIDFAPGRRQPRTIDLAVGAVTEPIVEGLVTTRIGKRAVVTYRLEFPGGGSGGEEGLLIGTLVLGTARLEVSCVTQAEGLQRGDAEWCLEELRRLRVAR